MEIEPGLFQKLVIQYESSTGHPLRQLYEYDAGKLVFESGKYPHGIFYIQEGKVKVFQEDLNLKDAIIRIAGPGEFLGYKSLILDKSYACSCEVLEKATIWFIGKPVFEKAFLNDKTFAADFVHLLCHRIDYAEHHIIDLKTKNVRQRLATALLSLNHYLPGETPNDIITIKRKDISSIINASPETISRHLGKFEEEGLVQLSQRDIIIKHPEGLVKAGNIRD